LSLTANNLRVPACCGLVQAVSKRAETATSLLLSNYLLSVSLFQDFREMAARNSDRQFRSWLTQLELRARFSQNRETAQQRAISSTKVNGCLFQPALKQREAVRNSQHITPGARR